MKYQIMITKDRKQYRLMNSFTVKTNAMTYYNNLRHENEKVKFDKQFISYNRCSFHIELLSPIKYTDTIEWEKDELGRNVEAPDRNGLYIWRLKPWKEPEVFGIYGKAGKYEYDYLYNSLKKTKEIIGMSTIQNILILDIDGKPLLVILKNVQDAGRLYQLILSEGMRNILPFGVMSKENRKGFYKIIKSMGIPIRMFYTNSTER